MKKRFWNFLACWALFFVLSAIPIAIPLAEVPEKMTNFPFVEYFIADAILTALLASRCKLVFTWQKGMYQNDRD
jgi:uncharacterized membrane protein YoaK (UPF0700 family)